MFSRRLNGLVMEAVAQAAVRPAGGAGRLSTGGEDSPTPCLLLPHWLVLAGLADGGLWVDAKPTPRLLRRPLGRETFICCAVSFPITFTLIARQRRAQVCSRGTLGYLALTADHHCVAAIKPAVDPIAAELQSLVTAQAGKSSCHPGDEVRNYVAEISFLNFPVFDFRLSVNFIGVRDRRHDAEITSLAQIRLDGRSDACENCVGHYFLHTLLILRDAVIPLTPEFSEGSVPFWDI